MVIPTSNNVPSSQITATENFSVDSTTLICPHCSQPRSFKGKRGLNIHISKCHRLTTKNSPSPQPSSSTHPINVSVSSDTLLWEKISLWKSSIPIIKRIPRGARACVAKSLAQTVKAVVENNDFESWQSFFGFSYAVLAINRNEKDRNISLTHKIKSKCVYPIPEPILQNSKLITNKNINYNIKKIETKLGDGDIKGAAQMLFSSDAVAPDDQETLESLRAKHPLSSEMSRTPDAPDYTAHPPEATPAEVLIAISSFRNGSAGGLDGLTPQHFKDLLSVSVGEAGRILLDEITQLVNLCLSGKVSQTITDLLYGASLCALKKKDGGIRPIAVGNTIRRLVSKICCKHVTDIKNYFQPVQLGFGTSGGCEAAVHSVRAFLQHCRSDVLLKVDVKNAFNSVDRAALLAAVKEQTPALYNYLWQCYSKPTKLIYRGKLLNSCVGCQQGDPLGPAIFSLAIHPHIKNLASKFNVWYLDDGTIGGEAKQVINDLKTIIEEFKKIGLDLNYEKCELYFGPDLNKETVTEMQSKFNSLAPGIKILNSASLRLLGAPVLDDSIPKFIAEKISKFQESSSLLAQLNPHVAYTIIKYCLFVPKFTYVLRCSGLWRQISVLSDIDNVIKNTLIKILNISLNERCWTQATLPIRYGGIGIRSVSSIALPAFLSSGFANYNLFLSIISKALSSAEIIDLTDAKKVWMDIVGPTVNVPISLASQRQWDEPLCCQVQANLLSSALDLAERARLLACCEPDSGHWLRALPSSNLGTLLDRGSFSLAMGLRLGTKINERHRCRCGVFVDQLGHHGLSCRRSAGRIPRHAAINDIIRRALTTVNIPAILEPSGLLRDDGKRPDGMSLIPWKNGRTLVWDATCVDTLAPSHLSGSASKAGTAAAEAEGLKRRKYSNLAEEHYFSAFAVETLGPWGPDARRFFKEISTRLIEKCGDPRAGAFFAQRISLAIQRGNAASLLGTLPPGGSDFESIFYII